MDDELHTCVEFFFLLFFLMLIYLHFILLYLLIFIFISHDAINVCRSCGLTSPSVCTTANSFAFFFMFLVDRHFLLLYFLPGIIFSPLQCVINSDDFGGDGQIVFKKDRSHWTVTEILLVERSF